MEKVEITKELLKQVEEEVKLKFKDEESEKKWNIVCEKNKGNGILEFASRWGKTMQYLVEEKEYELPVAADETQYVCDLEGLTGLTFGNALSELCAYWAYGEDLRKWHNAQYDYEGEGVVNPAVIGIKID